MPKAQKGTLDIVSAMRGIGRPVFAELARQRIGLLRPQLKRIGVSDRFDVSFQMGEQRIVFSSIIGNQVLFKEQVAQAIIRVIAIEHPTFDVFLFNRAHVGFKRIERQRIGCVIIDPRGNEANQYVDGFELVDSFHRFLASVERGALRARCSLRYCLA